MIGQMGTVTTNILFSKAGTTSIYLATTNWIEPFYRDLAVACDQHYMVIYSEPQDITQAAHLNDFTNAQHDLRKAPHIVET